MENSKKKTNWFNKRCFKFYENGTVWFYPWGLRFKGYEIKSEASYDALKKYINVSGWLLFILVVLWVVFIEYRIMDAIILTYVLMNFVFLRHLLKRHTVYF